jgi:16S rRNA C967 or C1407 C5-methylase (RsmB/RsmF family)
LNAGLLQEGSTVQSCSDIKVFAFDKDPKRVKRLAANVEKAGAAGIVSTQRADFLSVDPCDPQFAKVRQPVLWFGGRAGRV